MNTITRRQFIRATCAAGAATFLPQISEAKTKRPNIVFICTDDQAPWALRYSGDNTAVTPNLDTLFAQGAYLPNFFVTTPVCSPSRASTMTSRYGTEVGITDWIRTGQASGIDESETGIESKFPIWPEVLQQAGFDTALIGKWHLGVLERHHPTKHGYRYFAGFRAGGVKPVDAELEVDGKVSTYPGIADDNLTDFAVNYLKSRDAAQPFLLNVHYRWPHAPWQPLPEGDWAPFKGKTLPVPNPDYPDLDTEKLQTSMQEYLSACNGVDRNIGRVLSALDERGLADNTIVIFTSDNGYNMGHNGIWHKGNGRWILKSTRGLDGDDPRANRPNMYDNSLRVPTAVRWPGVTKPGARIEQTVSILDWFPTICEMARADMPRGMVHYGRDFTPLLRGKTPRWDNDLYGEYSQHHYVKTHLRMYRTPEWKLIRDFLRPGMDELYHLAEDPAENRNLINDSAHKETFEKLNARLLAKMKSLNDPVLNS
ncbi:MAG: sulfatase-like hydrolase/transferase [Candidatus Hydrogenedentes bacterium]|nr:sulfatase-like hydrolase/transferase [Candidatus Hydrogenedentota bacterium]